MEPTEEDYFYIRCSMLDSCMIKTGINVEYAKQCKFFVKRDGVRDTNIPQFDNGGDGGIGD